MQTYLGPEHGQQVNIACSVLCVIYLFVCEHTVYFFTRVITEFMEFEL